MMRIGSAPTSLLLFLLLAAIPAPSMASSPSAWTIVDESHEPLAPGVLLHQVRARATAPRADAADELDLRFISIDRSLLGSDGPLVLQPDAPAPTGPVTQLGPATPLNSTTSALSALSPGPGTPTVSSPAEAAYLPTPSLSSPSPTLPQPGPAGLRATDAPPESASVAPARLIASLIADDPAVEPHAGTRVRDGHLLWMQKGTPAVGFTPAGSVLFGVPLPYVTVTARRVGGAAATSFEIQAVNQPFAQQLTLYTEVNGATTGTPVGTTEIILPPVAASAATTDERAPAGQTPSAPTSPLALSLHSPAELVVAARRQSGNSPIPPGGAVLAVPNALAGPLLNSLINGRTVQIQVQLNGSWQDGRGTVLWQQATQVLPAQALLLGAGYPNPLLSKDPAAQRREHQLVVGVARDQLIFAESNRPVSLWDLGQFLQQSLGLSWAAALPAAGRSLYTISMDLAKGQHRLLALWNTAHPSEQPSFLVIDAPATRLVAGSSVTLTALAKDARGEPVALPPGSVGWRIVAASGSDGARLVQLDSAGNAVIQLNQTGQVLVQATVAGNGPPIIRTWQAEVVAPTDLERLAVEPTLALLEVRQRFQLPSVRGVDPQGRSVWIDPALLTWSVTPPTLALVGSTAARAASAASAASASSAGGMPSAVSALNTTSARTGLAGPEPGRGWLQVCLTTRPQLQAVVPMAVTGASPSPVDTFDAEPPAWRLYTQQVSASLAVARRQESAVVQTPPRMGNRVLAVTAQGQAGAAEPVLYLQAAGARPVVDRGSQTLGMWVFGPDPLPAMNVSLWDTAGRRYDLLWVEGLNLEMTGPATSASTPSSPPSGSPRWQYLIAPLPTVAEARLPLTVGRIGFVHPPEGRTTIILGLLEQWPVTPPSGLPKQEPGLEPGPGGPGLPASTEPPPAQSSPAESVPTRFPSAGSSPTQSSPTQSWPSSGSPGATPASSAANSSPSPPASTGLASPLGPGDSARIAATPTAPGSTLAPAPSLQSWPVSGSQIISPYPRFVVQVPASWVKEIDPDSIRFFVDEKLAWGREPVAVAGTGAYAPDHGIFWFEPVSPLEKGPHSYRWEATARPGSDSPVGAVQVSARFSVHPVSLSDGLGSSLRLAVIGSPGPPESVATDSLYEASWRIWDRLLADYVKSHQQPLDGTVRSQPPAPSERVPTNPGSPADLLVILMPANTARTRSGPGGGSPTGAGSAAGDALLSRVTTSLQTAGLPYLIVGASPSTTAASAPLVSAPTRLDLGDTRLLFLNDWLEQTGSNDPTLWDWLAYQFHPTAGIRRYWLFSQQAFSSLTPSTQQRLRQLLLAAAQTQGKALSQPTVCYISGEAGSFSAQQEPGGSVLYLNSGGGGQTLAASPEQGGYYHWLELTPAAEPPAQWAIYPVLERLTVVGLPRSLPVGATAQLTAVGDGYAGGQSPLRVPIQYPIGYRWQTSDPQRATVDPRTGRLVARAPGLVTIRLDVGIYHWEGRIQIEARS